jgi:hypothetical protein
MPKAAVVASKGARLLAAAAEATPAGAVAHARAGGVGEALTGRALQDFVALAPAVVRVEVPALSAAGAVADAAATRQTAGATRRAVLARAADQLPLAADHVSTLAGARWTGGIGATFVPGDALAVAAPLLVRAALIQGIDARAVVARFLAGAALLVDHAPDAWATPAPLLLAVWVAELRLPLLALLAFALGLQCLIAVRCSLPLTAVLAGFRLCTRGQAEA